MLTLNLPDSLNEKEVQLFLAAKLYENQTLTLGQAAELAGYSKATFMQLLADFDVSIFNYTEADLENDIQNAKAYHHS